MCCNAARPFAQFNLGSTFGENDAVAGSEVGQRIAAVVIASVALWAVSASAQKTSSWSTALETDHKAYEDAF